MKSAVETALPAMHRLAEAIEQSCHLVVPSREQIVVIARVDPPSEISIVVRVGHRRPLAYSTSGQVLFAYLAWSTSAAVLQHSHAICALTVPCIENDG